MRLLPTFLSAPLTTFVEKSSRKIHSSIKTFHLRSAFESLGSSFMGKNNKLNRWKRGFVQFKQKDLPYLKRVIITTIKDVPALAMCAALYPFDFKRLDTPRPGPDILCVHGYTHNGSAWGKFRKYIQNLGAGAVNRVTYKSFRKGIKDNALIVKAKADEIKEKTGNDVSVVVGHSEGGLVALEYALEHTLKDKTIYVITLGTPLHGTRIAKLGIGPGTKDMRSDSEYLKSLHERLKNATHIKVLCVYSDADEIVLPYSSAKLEKYEYATNVQIRIGHASLLFSEDVHAIVSEYLTKEGILSEIKDKESDNSFSESIK